jgi:hypothetical protein
MRHGHGSDSNDSMTDDDDQSTSNTRSDDEISEGEDIADDRGLFVSRSRLFDPYHLQGGLEPPDTPNHVAGGLPPAFEEHPAIRNAYIRAFVLATFKGSTHAAIKIMLDGAYVLLANSPQPIPGLEMMARTYPTVEKRLNVSFDTFIEYHFLCPICWHVYSPADLYKLNSPNCEDEDCEGILFKSKRLSDGSTKRTPTKVLPFVPPDRAIARWLLRPGKYEQLQGWRIDDEDEPGRSVPYQDTDGFNAFVDPAVRITDVTEGWGWRNLPAGLKRIHGGPWEITDVSDINQRFVNLPCGLVWQINVDW